MFIEFQFCTLQCPFENSKWKRSMSCISVMQLVVHTGDFLLSRACLALASSKNVEVHETIISKHHFEFSISSFFAYSISLERHVWIGTLEYLQIMRRGSYVIHKLYIPIGCVIDVNCYQTSGYRRNNANDHHRKA